LLRTTPLVVLLACTEMQGSLRAGTGVGQPGATGKVATAHDIKLAALDGEASDDAAATTYPGATEVGGDEVDQDCGENSLQLAAATPGNVHATIHLGRTPLHGLQPGHPRHAGRSRMGMSRSHARR
jgi:hypothetical protein